MRITDEPSIIDLLSGPPGVEDAELETFRSAELPRQAEFSDVSPADQCHF